MGGRLPAGLRNPGEAGAPAVDGPAGPGPGVGRGRTVRSGGAAGGRLHHHAAHRRGVGAGAVRLYGVTAPGARIGDFNNYLIEGANYEHLS